MNEPTPEEYEAVMQRMEGGRIRYVDVVDALSRTLLTLEEARAVCRRIFQIDTEPV